MDTDHFERTQVDTRKREGTSCSFLKIYRLYCSVKCVKLFYGSPNQMTIILHVLFKKQTQCLTQTRGTHRFVTLF